MVVRETDADKATFKQFTIGPGGIRQLKPLNPNFKTMQLHGHTMLCGVVVDQVFRKKVRRAR